MKWFHESFVLFSFSIHNISHCCPRIGKDLSDVLCCPYPVSRDTEHKEHRKSSPNNRSRGSPVDEKNKMKWDFTGARIDFEISNSIRRKFLSKSSLNSPQSPEHNDACCTKSWRHLEDTAVSSRIRHNDGTCSIRRKGDSNRREQLWRRKII